MNKLEQTTYIKLREMLNANQYGNPYFDGSIYEDEANPFLVVVNPYERPIQIPLHRPILDIGEEYYNDVKDLNLNPPIYEPIDIDYTDVSVIDSPNATELSESIWKTMRPYLLYSPAEYTPVDVEDARTPAITYVDYIARYGTLFNLYNNYTPTVLDTIEGRFYENESDLGRIGIDNYQLNWVKRIADITTRKTFGVLNLDAISLLRGETLLRQDFTITKSNIGNDTIDTILDLAGAQLPISTLDDDVWNLYGGNKKSTVLLTEAILKESGKGINYIIREHAAKLKYFYSVRGLDFILEDKSYVQTTPIVYTIDDVVYEGEKYDISNFEPPTQLDQYYLGEIGDLRLIHKEGTDLDMFSNGYWYWFTQDPATNEIIGYERDIPNIYEKGSLLHYTQELAINRSQDAFIDPSQKEFKVDYQGKEISISKGDATTSSGSYVDDDGTPISKNEYFRVWTKRRQMNKLSRTLRHRGLDNGDSRSVLLKNGLLNFAPTIRRADSGYNELYEDTIIKRYMFSIENLAWNDFIADLPECEQGVGDALTGHRGRLMWFPPYNLKIEEQTSVSLTDFSFIGRGEKIYTYNNTDRTATLSFSIIIDHPTIVNKLRAKRTEFWERYFKGDKLVEAAALKIINNRLSKQEQDELRKAIKTVKPVKKTVQEPVVTKKEKENQKADEATKKEDGDELGEKILSVYFPNQMTLLPPELTASVSLNDLQLNVGYEDGGKSATILKSNPTFNILKENMKIRGRLPTDSANDFAYSTLNGLGYTTFNRNPAGDNIVFRKVRRIKEVCLKDKADAEARGERRFNKGGDYVDRNNFGLNIPYLYQYAQIIKDKIAAHDKVRVTVVGNASGALPGITTNDALATNRANNTNKWLIQKLKDLGVPESKIEGGFAGIKVYAKADTEDISRKKLGLNESDYCEECDEADKKPCKQTRRADIYVKVILDDDDKRTDDDPIDPTPDDVEDEDKYQIDPNQDNPQIDPDIPQIDPSILDKLVYTECDFFDYMEINHPAFQGNISEKIKYFHPAFHSITPQGFNSRLTFLHQCCRQADNIGREGVDNITNLAFGRPPVCILRIGDFYHTKFMIEGYDISYGEGMNWDMNPEGVGVQPMYADITLRIVLLGGSSMTAPINRLQNALSFNFFANTEMYDSRADSVVFKNGLGLDENGEIKKGEIIDGIKLSNLTKIDKAKANAKIEKIRKESRIILENQNLQAVPPPTDIPLEYNNVKELLDLKIRLNMPLTEEEKIKLQNYYDNVNPFDRIV